MTKKEALKILEDKYKYVDGDVDKVLSLCSNVPHELRNDFQQYWKEINTTHVVFIGSSFDLPGGECYDFGVVGSMLRLMILFHFVEDTYK